MSEKLSKTNLFFYLILTATEKTFTLIVFALITSGLICSQECRISGEIIDWIGNDNGFGLVINGETYWLNYNGQIISKFPMQEWRGKFAILIYKSNIFDFHGSDFMGAFYLDFVRLTVV